MKRLFYPPPIRELFLVLSLLLVGNQLIFAEGSKDFWDSEGFRLFYLISPAANGSVTNEQQMKVYGAAGEFINVGSSHVGIQGGFILVYRPDGTLHSTFDGNDLSAIINNDIEELAGPTGGGASNGAGYIPGIIQVQAGEEGVWTVVLDYPPENYTSANFQNLDNGESWTRAVNQPATGRVALAWDITVSQGSAGNAGGTFVEGRVYSNEYISIVSQNGNATSPTFFVLTRSGFLYQIDFDQADPWGFPLFSNSRGIVTGDQVATNQSFDRADYIRSADIASWDPALNYLYHPQAEDSGFLSNNKIFFNTPDSNMPNTATVTDIINGFNTHTTWLFTEVADDNIGENPFNFSGNVPAGGTCEANLTMQEGEGGNFVYASQVAGVGQLKLDLNNNGSFDDPIDRIIESEAILGQGNSIFWDGLDGLGNVIPANPSFQFNYDLAVRGGEVHILMDDVENNIGGVIFTRLNGVNSPSNAYFYDHSQIELAEVSGGGTAGNALSTTDVFTYGNGLGNDVLLDFYTFIDASNFGSGAIAIAVEADCSAPVTPTAPLADNDGDGIDDSIDLDDDNDGISDAAELAAASNNGDTDGDGVPDVFDLDSDNDGISDLVEASHGQADANGDGVVDGAIVDFGANGLYNPLASSPDDLNAVINYVPADTDNDSVPDHIDLDSDNDGLLDVIEAGYASSDANNDGRIDDAMGNPSVGVSGLPTLIDPAVTNTAIPLSPDTDGDGVANWRDLDSDNDGVFDTKENQNLDQDNNGIIGTGNPVVNANGITTASSDGSGVTINPNVVNTDGTGAADYLDLDSDGDGLLDVAEAGLIDGDNNGILGTGTPTINVSGVPSVVDGNGNIFTSISNTRDSDNDGIPDFQDTQDNNPVAPVAPLADNDGDGIDDAIDLDDDNDGISDAAELAAASNNGDTDGDGVPDVFDLDSDNDGIFDLVEAGHGQADTNRDGVIDGANFGANGLFNPVASSPDDLNAVINYTPADTDNDGVSDYIDLDSDNDGIFDVKENQNIDQDNNGFIGTGIPIVNANGIATASSDGSGITINPNIVNTDGTGAADYLDLDSDGDGLLDVAEAGLIDGDNNGILGTGTPTVNVSGVPSAVDGNGNIFTSISNTRDSDNDGIPDFQDIQDNNPVDPVDPVDPVFVCDATTTPALSPTRGGAGAYCVGASAALSVSGTTGFTGPVNFMWTGPNGFTESGRLINANTVYTITISNLAVNNAGTYSLVLTTDEDCVSAPANITITVGQGPNASIQNNTGGIICGGGTASLSASPVGAGITYEWFRDGVSQGVTNDPAFSASSSGSYTVVARSAEGCAGTSSAATVVTIAGVGPSASIQSSGGGVVCSGESIELSASPVGAGITYEWFRDGVSQGVTTDPTFTTTSSGSYTVVARSAEGCPGASSQAIAISVNAAGPNASIQSNTSGELCSGEVVTFTASPAGAGISYEWFKDGVSQGVTGDPNFSLGGVTAASSGSYTVVASQNGCPGASSAAININVSNTSQIQSNIIIDNPILCEGMDFEINATQAGAGAFYTWFLNGAPFASGFESFIIVRNVTIANTGNYSVQVGQEGCTSVESSSVAVTVFPSVGASLSANGSSVCGGENLTLTATSSATGATYDWYRDGTLFTSTTNPSLQVNTSGTYTVITRQDICESAPSNPVVITVTDTPGGSNIAAGNASLCPGELVALTASDLGAGVTYNWYLNGNLVSSTSEPAYAVGAGPTTAGTYTMIPSIGICEGPISNSVAISVGEDSATPVIAADRSDLCPGENLRLTVSGVGGTPNYEWFRDGVSLGATSDPFFPTTGPGSYTVSIFNAQCGGGTSAPVVVTGAMLPSTGAISSDNNSLCPGENLNITTTDLGAGITYSWFRDGQLVTTTTTPVLATAAVAGSYTMVPSAGSCTGVSSNAIAISVGDNVATPTLSADRTNLCPGDGLTLSASGVGGTPNYEWFRDGVSLGATSDPFFPVPDASAGTYTVAVSGAECGGGTSNVVVVTNSAAPEAGVIMTDDADLCEGDNLNLTATDLGAGVSYSWFRDGNLISTTDVPSFSIGGAAGSYTMIPSISTCEGPESSAIVVTVAQAAAAPSITANNTDLCPGEGLVLTANGVGGPATYEWFLEGVSVQTTDEPILTLENASAGNYTVTASGGDCGGGTSAPFLINVAPIPDESAMVMGVPAIDDCNVTTTTLEANTPAFGTGMWSSSSPNIIFSDPTSPTTEVSGITGSSAVTWSLSNDCGVYSSEEVTIDVMTEAVTAADDNFTVMFNSALEAGNIIVNDLAAGDNEITIVTPPANGTASIVNGALQYVPNDGFSGTDVVEYEVCSNVCPEQVCDRAFANIVVENAPDCTIPNVLPDVITPNNDGLNETFNVPCTDSKDLGLKIFNRWGDEVFETDRYTNNWAGTHDGEPLPPGPYYYILTEPGAEKRTGCIAISR